MNQFSKPTKIRSKKITQSAKGESCTLQTPFCNNNPETTVFCHAPSEGKGMGSKSDDFWGAFGCSGCHQYVDRRSLDGGTRLYWYGAIFRTQKRLIEKGIIKVS